MSYLQDLFQKEMNPQFGKISQRQKSLRSVTECYDVIITLLMMKLSQIIYWYQIDLIYGGGITEKNPFLKKEFSRVISVANRVDHPYVGDGNQQPICRRSTPQLVPNSNKQMKIWLLNKQKKIIKSIYNYCTIYVINQIMNFLCSNDDDDGNFDSFITQNLKPEPPKEKLSNKKLQTAYKPIEIKSQFQSISIPKFKINQGQSKTSLWNIMLQHLNCTNQVNNFQQQRQILPYPLNSFFLSKIQEYRNKKIEAIISEIHEIEEFGDTTQITLKDQSGSCKASIISDIFSDVVDDRKPQIHNPVQKIQKKEDILIYLENVTIFSPNEFQITIIINRGNLKLAIF